jgi:hypothetical protein
MESPASPEHTRRNLRLSRTEFLHGEEKWYVLDNAASFMPGLTGRTVTLVYRLSVNLDRTVRLPALQAALAAIAPRFPYYMVVLRRGFFWYYFEPAGEKPLRVSADSKYPCLNLKARRGGYLFRVRAYDRRIAVEFCHILADGSGALAFLKALLLEYGRTLGMDIPEAEGIFAPGETPGPEESEDAFNRHVRPGTPGPERVPRAFHIPALPLRRGQYRIITGRMPLGSTLALSKSHGTSLTEFLAAAYLAALQELFYALPPPLRAAQHPVLSLEIPVNLRKLFPSGTMRNFTLYVLPSLDTRLGFYEFEEIATLVHLFMRSAVRPKHIARQIARNVMGGRSMLLRALPLGLKDLAARLVYKGIGENTMSGSLSNLGEVKLPAALSFLAEGFAFIPAPSPVCKTKAACLSYKDDLYFSFGSLASRPELERLFFSRLAQMGLPVSVATNL